MKKTKDILSEECAQLMERVKILESQGRQDDFMLDSQLTSEVLFSRATEMGKSFINCDKLIIFYLWTHLSDNC